MNKNNRAGRSVATFNNWSHWHSLLRLAPSRHARIWAGATAAGFWKLDSSSGPLPGRVLARET